MGQESAASKESAAEVNNEGFTVLWENREFPVLADVVFIHGLQGHPKKTWYYGRYETAIEDGRRKTAQRSTGACYWPQDILPKDFPSCRILTYGYDSHVSRFTGGTNRANILHHAASFIADLHEIRLSSMAVERPLIFIAHSLGGLVLKEALRKSLDAQGDIRSIALSTAATLFMGTPHRGSFMARPASAIAKITRVFRSDGTNAILRDLTPDSALLDLLTEGFGRVHQIVLFDVYSFTESQGLRVPFLWNDKVVTEHSSKLGWLQERTDVINADHRQMCRFSGTEDQGYHKVRNAMRYTLRRCIGSDYMKTVGLSSSEFEAALKDLDSSEARLRQEQIEPAFKDTFEWIYSNRSLGFLEWLSSDDEPLFWIKGKPASGKSTLMKLVCSNSRTTAAFDRSDSQCSTAAFFFHDRGAYLQKSFEGLLKSILSQILKEVSGLRKEAFKVFSQSFKDGTFEWDLKNLQNLLHRIVAQNEQDISILLFLDALDEYLGEHKEMARFLVDLRRHDGRKRRTRMKICFSSRLEQVFLDTFTDTPGLLVHEHTVEDIVKVVDVAFATSARMNQLTRHGSQQERERLQDLRQRIVSLSEGVFLWIRLILDELQTQFSDGSSLDELFLELETLPTDLHAFYAYLISKRVPEMYSEQSWIIFDLVRCALRPLHYSELVSAFRLATRKLPHVPLDGDLIGVPASSDEATRILRSRTGGLIEIGRHGEVQFLHQTVKTFAGKRALGHSVQHRSGYVNLLRFHIETIRRDGRPRWFIVPEDFVYYLHHAEVTTKCSQLPHFSQPPIKEISTALRSLTARLRVPNVTSIVEVAILANAPLTLAAALSHRGTLGDGIAYYPPTSHNVPEALEVGKDGLSMVSESVTILPDDLPQNLDTTLYPLAASRFPTEFNFFCRVYLRDETYGDPLSVSDVLLRRPGINPSAVWNGFLDLLTAQLRSNSPRHDIHGAVVTMVAQALGHGIDPNKPIHFTVTCEDSFYMPPWYLINFVLISKHPEPLLQHLIRAKVDLTFRDERGVTPLAHALRAYTFATINLLEGEGPEADIREYESRLRAAQLLVDHGAPLSGASPHPLRPGLEAKLRFLGYPVDERVRCVDVSSPAMGLNEPQAWNVRGDLHRSGIEAARRESFGRPPRKQYLSARHIIVFILLSLPVIWSYLRTFTSDGPEKMVQVLAAPTDSMD